MKWIQQPQNIVYIALLILALGITFPYNIIVLLPIMFAVSTLVHGDGSIDLFNYITKDWI